MKTLFFIPFLFMCSMVIGQSSKQIIGTPYRLSNIKVAQYDFPEKMSWYDAEKACADLGDGWRLPTKYELDFMYDNRRKIGGFGDYLYWSSTEKDAGDAWRQNFINGAQFYSDKDDFYVVRAVRSL